MSALDSRLRDSFVHLAAASFFVSLSTRVILII